VPDVTVEDHPVVAVLAGQRNPLLDAVRVERAMAVERTFTPPPESGLRRLLSLRSGGPLIVERPFGDGLAVAVLTTGCAEREQLGPRNPSWVVVMLELESSPRPHPAPGGIDRGRRTPAGAARSGHRCDRR